MTSFDARLRMAGEGGLPLGVEVDILNQRMIITAGTDLVADWSLDEINIASFADGFHIRAEGEELVLNVTDERQFVIELGEHWHD